MGRVEVVVDDREPLELAGALRNLKGCDVEVGRLSLGDCLFDRKVLFERKTFADFVASIKSGRLFRQACRLASSKYRTVIVLEGRGEELAESKMRREAIQGTIISLTVVLGLPLLRSQCIEETARLMAYAIEQIRRQPQGAVYRHGYRPKGERKRKLFVLQGLPGVGPNRAERLLDHFGSLEAVFFAEADELAEVSGLGYPTAKKIRSLTRRSGK